MRGRRHGLTCLVVGLAGLSGLAGRDRLCPLNWPGRDTGRIEGAVRDARTQSGLARAFVVVVGTLQASPTDTWGRFVLEDVPSGARMILAVAEGFSFKGQVSDVIAGDTVSCDFSLTRAASTGNSYYVSPSGSDSNPGTRDKPWATPGHGSRQLEPGDTLVILGGRYVLRRYDEDIIKPPSGTEDAWVVIRGEEDNTPVLMGRDDLAAAIDLTGQRYVSVQNLEITHDNTASGPRRLFRDGVQILGETAEHVVLKNLHIHHIDEMGLDIQDVNDLQVLDCRFEYCGFGAIGGPAAASGGWQGALVQGCRLSWSGHYYQGGNGSNRPYDRPDGFGVEPSSGSIEIVDTVAEHNFGDGLDSKAAQTTIRRCVVANNSCDGVKLWAGESRVENTLIYGRGDGNRTVTPWAAIVIGTETDHARFEIVNCTLDDELGHNYLMYVQYDSPETPVELKIINTVFCGRGPGAHISIGEKSVLTAEYNLFYFPRSDRVLEHGRTCYTKDDLADLGSGNIYGQPLFQRTAWGGEGDYHLLNGSPAIDRGTADGAPTEDLDRTLRPQGFGSDIGSYER